MTGPGRQRSSGRRAAPELPWPLRLCAAVAVAFFVLPLVALVARAPLADLAARVASPAVLGALWLSVECSLLAALVATLTGVPLAAWLAQGGGAARAAVRALVTLPMVLPPVVGGVALLFAFGRNGLVGRWIDAWFGVSLPFTTAGVVAAEVWVAMPFLVLTVEGGLRGFDGRFAGAAATLGASPWRILGTVTLPMIAPTLRAGVLVAWARALGEFGATITFAGNLAGETRTMPLAVYTALETDPDAAIVMSLLLVAVAGAVLIALRRQWFPGGASRGAA